MYPNQKYLKDQGVTDVHRITITKNDNKIPTRHIILTISSPKLPRSIKAGYLECSVRPYIPNPLCCFKCQQFGHSKMSCRGNLTCGHCGAVGHDSLNCNEPFSCVNCKGDHPSYSRNCHKWITEKEIQTIRTKQNISYPEARKIVESWTPTIGITYAAITSKPKDKNYQSIGCQTEYSLSIESESLTSSTQSQTRNKSLNKQLATSSESSISSKPSMSKLPVHKKAAEIASNKNQLMKQNQKSSCQKQTFNATKSTTLHNNPAKKVKTNTSKNKQKKKEIKSSVDSDALSLHPTDSSDNEEVMSIASNLSNPDTYI